MGEEIDFFFGAYGFEGRGLAFPMDGAEAVDGIGIVFGEFVISFGETGHGILRLGEIRKELEAKFLNLNLSQILFTSPAKSIYEKAGCYKVY